MLDGKVAMITGAASGIGRETARRFAKEGAKVAVVSLKSEEERAVSLCAEIAREGGAAVFIPCDVSREEDVRAAVKGTIQKFGRLDIVMANAGINGVWAPIDELMPGEWDRTIAVNLRGTYLAIHCAVPELKRAGGGSIIIVSSVNGTRTFANAGSTAYSVSKAGQVALMKMAALELAASNIRVNAICPGATDTEIGSSTIKRNVETIKVGVHFPHGAPGIRNGQARPADIADVCLFLASDLARHVSGAEIFVDGGFSLAV